MDIETERLKLIPVSEEYVEEIYKHFNVLQKILMKHEMLLICSLNSVKIKLIMFMQ